jgi:hypothetical protein
MTIVNMPKRTLVEVAKFAILIEKKLHVKQKNMPKYCPNNSNSDESEDNDEDEHYKKKTKKKSKNMNVTQ